MASSDLKKVGLVFTAEGAPEFSANIKEITNSNKQLYSQLKQSQAQYTATTSSVDKLKDRQTYLKGVTENYKTEVAALEVELKNEMNAEEKDADAISKTQTKLEKAKAAEAQYEASLKEVTLQLETGAAQLYEYSDKLDNVSKKAKSVGSTLTKTVTVGVVAAGAAAVSAGSEFETAMSQVAATMGTTTDEIQDLEEVAKEMGETTAFSATEAAEGLNILAMSGLSAEEQIAALPQVLNLAAAGAMDLDTAASYVTGTIKGFGDSCDNAQKYVDIMAKGATLANTDVSSLGTALSNVSSNSKSYSQSVETTTVALLGLAEGNVTGEKAATMLNRAMADLYTPTDSAKTALKELGVSCYDESGNARDLMDVINDLQGALSGMSEEEQTAYKDTIFTTNGLNAFNKIAGVSTDTVQEWYGELENASDAMDGQGSAAEQAATQLDNLEGKTTLLKSALEGLGIKISEVIMPILEKIVEKVTDVISWLNSLDDTTATMIVTIAGVAAAIGPVLVVIGTLGEKVASALTMFGDFKMAMAGSAKTTSTLANVVKGLSSTVTSLNIPIAAIIAVIALVVAAIIDLWNTSEEFRENISSMVNNLMSIIQTFYDSIIAPIIEAIKQMLDDMWENGLKPLWDDWEDMIAAIIEVMTELINVITPIVNFVIEQFGTVIPPIVDTLGTIFSTVFTVICTVLSTFLSIATTIFSTVSGIISSFQGTVSTVFNTISNTIQTVWKTIQSVTNSAWQAIQRYIVQPIQSAYKTVSSVVGSIYSTISNTFSSVYKTVSSIFSSVYKAIQGPMQQASNFISGIVKTIKGFFNFTISWPSIKLPHFSITPSGWGIGDLLKGKIPTLGISWYAKAMDEGMFLDGATIFGSANGQLLGGGEVGSETIVGTQSLMDMITKAVAENNKELVALLAQLVSYVCDEDKLHDIIVKALTDGGVAIICDNREIARIVRKYQIT